jgi:Flp pilus assembly protein TadB
MLQDYVLHGMPEVKDRVLDAIDEERRWRHARAEQQQDHAHLLEREAASQNKDKVDEDQAQQRRGQRGALVIALVGLVATLVSVYMHAFALVSVAIALICVGGPQGATITARLLDRTRP